MAKGPGPAVLLAGAAALFLLKGKGKPADKTGGLAIDPEGDASDADVGGGAADGSGGGSGGGVKNIKTVPNPSLDPKGYDTQRWQDGYDVRVALASLGYLPVSALIEQPLTDSAARSAVKKFQKDYNAGDATVELGQFAGEAVPGYLEEDKGLAGKNVLNALEIVVVGFPDGTWAAYYN